MQSIVAWHVLIISNRTTKCKRSLNKNKNRGYLTKVRIGHNRTPTHPKIQKREVGPATLCVRHSIPVFIFCITIPPPPFKYQVGEFKYQVSKHPPVTFILGSHLPTVIFCCIVGPLVRSWLLTLGGLRGRMNQHPFFKGAKVNVKD